MMKYLFILCIFLSGCKVPWQKSAGRIQIVPVVMQIQIADQTDGSGVAAVNDDEISIAFKIWAYDPNKTDGKSNLIEEVSSKSPLILKIGSNKLFTDWEKSMIGMKVNGIRSILLPPSSGYGTMKANPMVKPSTPLLIEVELLNINRK